MSENITSDKVIVNGWNVWYDKYGCGPIPLLLIPGAIGTGKTDFGPQLNGENALDLNTFSIIAVELPGWGRSRPPSRPYGKDVFNNDADCCVKLMKHLGYDKFSILGWSDGANVALVISVYFPECVQSVIMWGIITFATERNIKNILSIKDVENWSNEMIENYLKFYEDIDEIQDLWDKHLEFIAHFGLHFTKGITNDKFDTIDCPVLIVHGDKDPLVQIEQPIHLLNKIKSAKFHRFTSGSHNLHQVFQNEFRILVEDFFVGHQLN